MSDSTIALSLWESVNQELKNLFPADLYDMWFEGLTCVEESDAKIVLSAPNEFNAIWIENNYLDIISQQARSYAGTAVAVTVEVAEEDTAEAAAAPTDSSVNRLNQLDTRDARSKDAVPSRVAPVQTRRTFLNPRNTFDNFVVGSGNQLSHAASMAVANAPGRAYNPLFVYGETGLGKTHLMHAVAHQMLANNPNARIAYVSTEKFTNEFIHAIRENKLTKFRKYYRTVDALLVDDIHFLSGKESTQEEFFHTFNDLFESGRQIFLASDRPANEIERLENRLISRFQWGLVTDIQAPDFETRVAILRNKAAAMNISLAPEIMNFLAERVSRNVRRMEGALTRIASYDSLINKTLDLDAVERLLSDLLHEETLTKVTVDQIQKKVSDYYQIRFSELIGRRRTSAIVFPRQVAMYISRTLTSDPLKSIGDAFGGRDHGTVIHACKQVENMMEQDGSVKRGVDYLIKQLSQGGS
ncbi:MULTISPECIES: chromosomal replication initiator protein DnaA [unclassified Lentimonas]|uniref:chromosomal replication initiator protein DnaA n=1 Tax=unclassified Lentimonas TaxID=2630993 RepID=UPI001322B32B|nr:MULTISPECIES: chromosomal replication initiator protein DnaA [unclassified Lentimonas]CAA6679596.1 Chromosomal replication initiator protein DnaA [Lentimonas sp. CC4]CAA6687314.1 Chromosomal replication initiator protein DnaA [Lentimonas sp. CC6]CAA6696778.1 Chromosomal replication initiator protein DnaA [Lentimonas sp. CC19]CAA6697427.1 Chromosomal replication initiator protein DnaA [Lentimonas sp. CC10]CAA7071356.1 Chromosomal replication initiator protein DnaA [Lentimonas sp. CC11]